MHSHLQDALANGPDVSEIAELCRLETGQDARTGFAILQAM